MPLSRHRAILGFLIFASIIFCPKTFANEDPREDSLSVRLYFEVEKSDAFYSEENRVALSNFKEQLDSLRATDGLQINRLVIRPSISPEGPRRVNAKVLKNRERDILAILRNELDLDPASAVVEPVTNQFEYAEQLLRQSGSPNAGRIMRAITSATDSYYVHRDLLALDKGRGHIFAEAEAIVFIRERYCDIVVFYTVPETKFEPEIVPEPEHQPEIIPEPQTVVQSQPQPEPEPEPLPVQNYCVTLKTNVLYDIATVANLSAEVGFKDHFSVELLATFSPWDIGKPTRMIRTLLFQPEARYYLADGWKGHYFGVHAHCGWYNVALGGKTRFQDKDGKSPLLGAGLTYGYVLPFNEHWGAEFSIGAGYAYLNYDRFYNLPGGARYGTEVKHYFGPTKIGASIYYRF